MKPIKLAQYFISQVYRELREICFHYVSKNKGPSALFVHDYSDNIHEILVNMIRVGYTGNTMVYYLDFPLRNDRRS